MSVETVYVVRLTCDGCGATTEDAKGGAKEVRYKAALEGWGYLVRKLRHVDICPACDRTEVMKHLEEVWATRKELLDACRSDCRLAHNASWKPPCRCLLALAGQA